MQTFLKLHIVLFLFIASTVFSNPTSSSLRNKENNNIFSKANSIDQIEFAQIEFEYLVKTQKLNESISIYIYDAPVFPGDFKSYFSIQSILPQSGTYRRFSRKLRV